MPVEVPKKLKEDRGGIPIYTSLNQTRLTVCIIVLLKGLRTVTMNLLSSNAIMSKYTERSSCLQY